MYLLRQPVIDSSSEEGFRKDTPLNGKIEFRNVHFSYPSRSDTPVLKGLNLTIEAGSTLALVGANGTGKSTCLQLLQRFYDPDEGEVRENSFGKGQAIIGENNLRNRMC